MATKLPRLELITTGSELLLGFTVNTHVNYIARELGRVGLRLARQSTVGDDVAEMRHVVAEAIARSDVLLITGGLGPTKDDCTRDVVAALLGRKLVRDEPTANAINDRYRRRGMTMPESVAVQAMVPEGASILANRNGTAPGLQLECDGKTIFLLPGPPRELKPMFEEVALPWLKRQAEHQRPFQCRSFKIVGLAESIVEERVVAALADWPELELAYCAKLGELEFRFISDSAEVADRAAERVHAVLGDSIFGYDDDRMEEVVVKRLTESGQTLAVAESCTGGLIANRITNVSGASAVFHCGCVTYANQSKIDLLGVGPELIESHGAVSESVARAMADGIRQRSQTDFGLSTTGIAGPSGGTAEKPVGLVYIALATASGTEVNRHQLTVDRETFKFFASQYALDMLRRELMKRDGRSC